jgi:hypothetical protein
MTWLGVLMVVLMIAVVAAVTGIKPAGTRRVARTRLMGVARVILLGAILLAGYYYLFGRTAGN